MVISFDHRMDDSMVCAMAGLVLGFSMVPIKPGIDRFYRPRFLHLRAGQKRTCQLAELSYFWVCDLTPPYGNPWTAGTICTSFI